MWKEVQLQQWTKIYEYADHQSSVNSIAFAPHELGLKLAAASADGTISILSWRGAGHTGSLVISLALAGQGDNSWDERVVHDAHQIGCNAVSWAPAAAPGSSTTANATSLQAGGIQEEGAKERVTWLSAFVSGGCDGVVRIWRIKESGDVVLDEEFNRMYQVRTSRN